MFMKVAIVTSELNVTGGVEIFNGDIGNIFKGRVMMFLFMGLVS